MKTQNHTRLVGLLLLAFLSLLLAPCSLLAQDAAPIATTIVLPPEAQNLILTVLGKLMESHPWVATVIAVLGSMRLWAKPVGSLVHSIIEITPSKYDDGIWASAYKFLTEHPFGKFLAYLLDWIGSVKIAPPAPPAPPKDPLGV